MLLVLQAISGLISGCFQGLVYEDRLEGGLSAQKLEFARSAEEGRMHAGAEDFGIAGIRPTALIGASARRATFSEPVIRALVQVCMLGVAVNACPHG